MGHTILEWFWHAKTSVVAENFPCVHALHDASFIAEPGKRPCPRGHEVVECFWQEEVPKVAENELDEHARHVAAMAEVCSQGP